MAATDRRLFARLSAGAFATLLGCVILSGYSSNTAAVVLPKERSDIMYHRYDGGGMEIDGPSVLVRKNFADKLSVAGNYYVDNVSSASIDVLTSGASAYTEEREEYSIDFTYLEGKSLVNIGYTNSEEDDYSAASYRIDISQDFFGDMTTLSIGYSQADDEVKNNLDADFEEEVDRRHYRLGISQVLHRLLLLSINYEAISDEGFLNNPYRSIRFDDGSSAAEVYPNTRNSDAVSLKLAYHLPWWNAAVKARHGIYSDSWSIDAQSFELEYSHSINRNWLADLRLRHYQQDAASFYSDIFAVNTIQNFQARDKELSEYSNYSIGFGASYNRYFNGFIDRAQASLQFDWLTFDYDNFREATEDNIDQFGIGNEPLYSFDAYALRLLFSIWY